MTIINARAGAAVKDTGPARRWYEQVTLWPVDATPVPGLACGLAGSGAPVIAAQKPDSNSMAFAQSLLR